MDDRELRLRKIELEHHSFEKAIELQMNLRLGIIFVVATLGGGALVASATERAPLEPSVVVAAGALAIVATQVLGLRALGRTLRSRTLRALEAIDKLMRDGGG